MNEYRTIIMYSHDLKREVRVFLMLPSTYYKSQRNYPVLYMHDGQNLFDSKLAYGGDSWGIFEAYKNNPDLPQIIVVGIENGQSERTNELVPFKFNFANIGAPEHGDALVGGKADLYYNFILNDVKPFIDKNFRSFKSAKNTGIMGSSFGGVSSMYAACHYNDYFSRFGCLSNAWYVVQDEMEKMIQKSDLSKVKKLYMDVGTKESSKALNNELYISSNNKVYDIIKDKLDPSKLKYEIIEGAKHYETAWAKRLPDIIRFLFND